MNRIEALNLLKQHISNDKLVKHCISVEGGMQKMARFLGENEEKWGLAGLLHDLDYEQTKENFAKHGFVTAEILKNLGFNDEEILNAIIMHSGNIEATSKMGKALYAVDPAAGLITASVLMFPTKNIHQVTTAFLMKRFKEKRFAANIERKQIVSATDNFNLSLEDFLTLVLEGMREKSSEIALGN